MFTDGSVFVPILCGIIVVFQLYNVNANGDPEESIYGIMFEKFPATPKSDRKYFVMVSTLRSVLRFNIQTFFTILLDFPFL